MAAIVCFQSHFITEGKNHIFPPPFVMHTFPHPNFSFQEPLFSSSCPFHPCSTFPVQTGESTPTSQSESTNHQPNIYQALIICLRLALILLYFILYRRPKLPPSRTSTSSPRGQISQSYFPWTTNGTPTRKYYQSTLTGFQLQHVVPLSVITVVPRYPEQDLYYVVIPNTRNFIPRIL